MSESVHDEIAKRIARKLNTEYKASKGIDIVTKKQVIEVETKKESILQGIKQVVHSPKPRYLAVNQININNALKSTEGTGIGVMNQMGRVIKKAGRKG